MINKTIRQLEIEEIEGEWVCTIVSVHYGEKRRSKLTLDLDEAEKASVTAIMYHVGKLLSLENENTGTLDFQQTKEFPHDHNVDTSNMLEVIQAPGRTFWLASGYR